MPRDTLSREERTIRRAVQRSRLAINPAGQGMSGAGNRSGSHGGLAVFEGSFTTADPVTGKTRKLFILGLDTFQDEGAYFPRVPVD